MHESSALVFEGRQYSPASLNSLADGLAAELATRGVCAGQRVALMSSNRPEFVIAVQAVWRLGAAVVLLSPAWKRFEVEHALALTGPSAAVGDHPVLAELMPMLSLDEPIRPAADFMGTPRPGGDAVLVFSSGTTGMPKAVRHTHASLDAAVQQWRQALGMTAADRIQVLTPPSHILGLLNILTAFAAGAQVRLHRRFDLERMLETIAADRITIEMAVAPIALALASHPDLESYDLSSLRYIMWGATPVTVSVAETVIRRTGVSWLPAYGASEVPVIACNPLIGARLDTVGQALPGVAVRVVSTDSGVPLDCGETGEIEVRSPARMAGYLPAHETEAVLHEDWYRTGDIGRVDADGWVWVTDRAKDMIKVRGFQVAPAEIEAVLLAHPAVRDCAVFGIADAADGEAVVAAVATREATTEAALAQLVTDSLAPYKRLRRVVFTDDIPRLPSGKVLRRVLEERYGNSSDR
ncbi:MAG: AMP-binding protein [Nocardia sp.]|nr:AMP-binding protein [Nocardia sp.]